MAGYVPGVIRLNARQRAIELADIDAAWLAAAIDGEGSLRLDRPRHCRPDYLYPRLSLWNTHLPFLEHAQTLTQAGRIYSRKKEDGRKQVWCWVVCGQAAVDIVGQILPWLIIKQEKALEVVASEFALAGGDLP